MTNEDILNRAKQTEEELANAVSTLHRFKSDNVELKQMYNNLQSQHIFVEQELEHCLNQLKSEQEERVLKENAHFEEVANLKKNKNLFLQDEQEQEMIIMKLKLTEEIESVWSTRLKTVENELRDEKKAASTARHNAEVVTMQLEKSIENSKSNRDKMQIRHKEEIAVLNDQIEHIKTELQKSLSAAEETSTIRKELEQAKIQIVKLRQDLTTSDQRYETMTTKFNRQIADLREKISGAENVANDLRIDIEKKKKKILNLEEELCDAKQSLEEEIDKVTTLEGKIEESSRRFERQNKEILNQNKVKDEANRSAHAQELENIKKKMEEMSHIMEDSDQKRRKAEKDLESKKIEFSLILKENDAILTEKSEEIIRISQETSSEVDKIIQKSQEELQIAHEKTQNLQSSMDIITDQMEHLKLEKEHIQRVSNLAISENEKKIEENNIDCERKIKEYFDISNDYEALQKRFREMLSNFEKITAEKLKFEEEICNITAQFETYKTEVNSRQISHSNDVSQIKTAATLEMTALKQSLDDAEKRANQNEVLCNNLREDLKKVVSKSQKKFQSYKTKCHLLVDKCKQFQMENASIANTLNWTKEMYESRLHELEHRRCHDTQIAIGHFSDLGIDEILSKYRKNDEMKEIKDRLSEQADKYIRRDPLKLDCAGNSAL
eukprot:GHVL01027193.1.p1 GENE.GHVL01027193.1~~GHVL01027193.1.p1  ORF type:complete len:668 (+),score=169.22 GHVL01027193.1:58-2061(+)